MINLKIRLTAAKSARDYSYKSSFSKIDYYSKALKRESKKENPNFKLIDKYSSAIKKSIESINWTVNYYQKDIERIKKQD